MGRPATGLSELFKQLRRIIVLSVAAIGLWREMPYTTLALRLAVLWAILYVATGVLDLVLRRMTYKALLRDAEDQAASTDLQS